MLFISSVHHPLIKEITQLHSVKGRTLHHKGLGEGLRTCTTIAQSPLQTTHLFVTQDYIEQAEKLVSHELIVQVSERVFAKISTATTPSGMLIVFHIPQASSPEQISTGLVLAQISDPGNMGTLIRTSVALNYPTIVIVDGVDPWNPKVVQSTAGTIGNIAIIRRSWEQLMDYCSSHDFKISALVVRDGENFFTTPRYERELFVVGSEASGIPQEWVNMCDRQLTLPMPGTTESLNAAIAGSLALYGTYLRQQNIYE